MQWLNIASPTVCVFCRLTQQGFLRLATNPAAVGKDALTMDGAWGAFDRLFDDPRIGFADEPEDIERAWRSFTQGKQFSPKVWNDAYLAAFAQAADFELVTFDQGLSQYKGPSATILR